MLLTAWSSAAAQTRPAKDRLAEFGELLYALALVPGFVPSERLAALLAQAVAHPAAATLDRVPAQRFLQAAVQPATAWRVALAPQAVRRLQQQAAGGSVRPGELADRDSGRPSRERAAGESSRLGERAAGGSSQPGQRTAGARPRQVAAAGRGRQQHK